MGLVLSGLGLSFGCAKGSTLTVKPSTPAEMELIPASQLKKYVYKKILLLPIPEGTLQGTSQLSVVKGKDEAYYGAKMEKALLAQGFEVISPEIVARVEKNLRMSSKLSPAEKALVMGKETKADAVFLVQELAINSVSDFYSVEDLKTMKVDPSRVKADKKGRLYNQETEECIFQLPYYEIRFEGKLIDARSGNVLWVGSTRETVIDELDESWVAKLDKKCELTQENFVFGDYVAKEPTLDATFHGLLVRLLEPLKKDAHAGTPIPSDQPPPPKVVEKPAPPPPPPPPEEPKIPTAVVSAPKAVLRAGPGQRNDRIAYVTRKTKVEVLETMGEWSKVRLQNGAVGWIHESTIIMNE